MLILELNIYLKEKSSKRFVCYHCVKKLMGQEFML